MRRDVLDRVRGQLRRRHAGRGSDLVVDALAVTRIVRFIQQDSLIFRQREAVKEALARGGHHKLAELLECPWCLSVHVAAGWSVLRLISPRIATAVGSVLASSYAASALIELLDAIETD